MVFSLSQADLGAEVWIGNSRSADEDLVKVLSQLMAWKSRFDQRKSLKIHILKLKMDVWKMIFCCKWVVFWVRC